MKRLIESYIFDPEMTGGKMIFLSGPRQVGKATFAKMWLASQGSAENYFNWDDPAVMGEYRRNPLFFHNVVEERFAQATVPLVFDEIHKHKEWRSLLKGLFDAKREKMRLLVTGSARLDFVRRSGDSLLGRYFSYRLFPLGLPEVLGRFSGVLADGAPFADGDVLARCAREVRGEGADEGLRLLLKFGGFPEPFIRGSEKFHRRWQKDYQALLTKEDIRELSRIADIKGLASLVEILPTKVGSRLSVPSLCRDLGKKYETIKNWLDVLESLYLVFLVNPWYKRMARTIKKEKKLYFLDWSLLSDPGRRFENLLAVALVRMAARFTEMGLGDYEVCYIRDREQHEVDFVLVKDKEPMALIEAKKSESGMGRAGRYYVERLKVPLFQVAQEAQRVEAFPGNCFVVPASRFLLLTG